MKLAISPAAMNSWIVLLPANEYSARTMAQLAILNPFAVCGWLAMGWFAWRRRQANWFVAGVLILVMASTEASVLGSVQSMLGAFMRLSFGQ